MDFSLMKDFMDRLTAWRIPGNSISVCVGNKEVFKYQSGYENLEKKIKMSDDKLFNVYSCTKPLTVTAALQLYEKGYFLLDDPLYDFIPEYKNMTVRDSEGNITEAKNHITLRHLFTMTSGLTYNSSTPAFDKAREITGGKMDTITVAKCMAEDPLAFEPGEDWRYSFSHDVLAAVVSVISGKPFRQYVKENIFDLLDMKDSFFHNDDILDRVATIYRFKDGQETDLVKLQSFGESRNDGYVIEESKHQTHVFGPEYDAGGAGLTTSVDDYSKFASALANGGVGRNKEQIISAGTIELLRTNQLNEKQLEKFNWNQLKGYGYGLGVRTMMDIAKGGSTGNVGEFGWGGAAGGTVLVDPELNVSMFYTHHMLNPQEAYYQPRVRNVLYTCLKRG